MTAQVEPITASGADSRREASPHILVVDDDPMVRNTVMSMLRAQGFQPQGCSSGAEALQAIEAHTPDLIVLDYTMPGMDGIELCRLLRERRATRLIPIIMITGVLGTEMAVQALESGVTDFLNKPINLAELEARVHAHLRSKFLVDQLEDLENVILAMTKAVEAKDPYTEGHSGRVAELAVRVGEAMGLDEDALRSLRLGGLLHDIGKIAIPDRILQKPDELSEEERHIVSRHAAVSQDICESIHSLTTVADIIRHHHEKMDGSGYPDGLRGDQIALPTRILTTCDIFDSLTTRRPYREPMSAPQACRALDDMARDGQLDPAVTAKVRQAVSKNGDAGSHP